MLSIRYALRGSLRQVWGVQVWWTEDGRNAMDTAADKAYLLWLVGMVFKSVKLMEVKTCRDPSSITVPLITPFYVAFSIGLVVGSTGLHSNSIRELVVHTC
jgi:hypothetical protein